jgi:Fungal Zn(2)-Cys(6) binuclear cluster domain
VNFTARDVSFGARHSRHRTVYNESLTWTFQYNLFRNLTVNRETSRILGNADNISWSRASSSFVQAYISVPLLSSVLVILALEIMSTDKRKTTACTRCHNKKIKCSGSTEELQPLRLVLADSPAESPCQNCSSAGAECAYPIRDRNIVVPASYLQSLHSQAYGHPQTPLRTVPAGEAATRPYAEPEPSAEHRTVASPVLKNSTAEAFVSGLKKLSGRQPTFSSGDRSVLDPSWNANAVDASDVDSQYEYVPLNFDTSCMVKPAGKHSVS